MSTWPPAGADLLAGRRRAADHLGPGRHARAAGRAEAASRQNLGIYRQQVIGRRQVIMRWLAHRGGALDFRDFARGQPRPAVPDRRGAGRRPGDHPRRRDAGAGHACPSTSSPGCCAAAAPSWSTAAVGEGGLKLQVPASAEIVLEGHIPPAPPRASRDASEHGVPLQGDRRLPACAGRPVRRPHRLLQRAGLVSGVRDRAHDAPPRPDLPLHLHRQAARRAGGARRGAERSVRADPAEAVSGDRRLLPAARRLQLPPGGDLDPQGLPRPRQAA